MLGVWLLAWLCWQIGLNYKSCFDTINKGEELDGTALWREDERVISYSAFRMLL